ncbi:MAG TPA: hypothetical protein VK034_30975 [Enhygromyxa sp.]|nr:hypothetical protein [Enhygromyxa sp.]
MARPILASIVIVNLILIASACDPKEDPYKVPQKKGVDLHKIDNEMTQEELAAARKEAGIKSPEEIAAENAAWYETEMHKYVKARLPDYRKLIGDMRAMLDEIEKQAPKWKDDKAFEKYRTKHQEKVAELWKFYDDVTGKGGEGGNTQIPLAKAAEGFEQLENDIGPGVAENEAFPGALKEIRDNLDKVTAALDDIEKDESLDVAEGETGGDAAAPSAKEEPKK